MRRGLSTAAEMGRLWTEGETEILHITVKRGKTRGGEGAAEKEDSSEQKVPTPLCLVLISQDARETHGLTQLTVQLACSQFKIS